MAWISTLPCISAPYTLITMTFRAACSFSFQYTLIMEWQVKKPHAVVGSQIPASLSHGKQFQTALPLSCYNKASALWHGKNALSPSSAERAIEGRPGLLSAAQALTVTQASGWWASDLHTALARRLRRRGGGEHEQGQEMKQGCMTCVKRQKYVVVRPNLGPEAAAELKKKKKKKSPERLCSSYLQQCCRERWSSAR